MASSHSVSFLTPQRPQPTAPLFVFLPGMDGTGQLLRSQLNPLGTHFDIRCLAIPLNDRSTWAELTEQVVKLIAAELVISPSRLVYLCGESFGGCLAMKVALAAPQICSHLILVNPASSLRYRPWVAWGSQLAGWLPEALYHVSAGVFLPLLAHLERIATADRQALIAAVQSVPQETLLWRLSLLNQFELSAMQLRQLSQPVLLVASAADRLLPSVPEAYRLAKLMPKARLVVMPNSGHACLLEADVNLYAMMKTHHLIE